MSRCTCSKDPQITCAIHPTEVSLHQHIAELEAERFDLDTKLLVALAENAELEAELQRQKNIVAIMSRRIAEMELGWYRNRISIGCVEGGE